MPLHAMRARMPREQFFALPTSDPDLPPPATFGIQAETHEGMPLYTDADGEAWVLQVGVKGALYRAELL